MTHVLGYFHEDRSARPPAQWPFLKGRPVTIGGLTVTCAQAETALAVLSRSGGVMVAQVLRAAGSPLADCDYRAAADSFCAPAARVPSSRTSRRGAAGRPVTKAAFMSAIAAALDAALAGEPALHYAADIKAARRAFGADAGYAAAMARAAVDVSAREHLAGLRASLARGAAAAVSACAERRGEFACAETSACGTGGCRFAAGLLSTLRVPAGPGRLPRPANHTPGGFGLGPATAALAAAVPFTVGVRVHAADTARAADAVPGAAAAGTVAA